MDWKEIAAKIVEYAPSLGGALGGPPGAAAGLALRALAGIFGLRAEATPEEIRSTIDGDPERAMKLRLAEMHFHLETTRLELADVKSARERQVESERVTGKRDANLYILAWVVIAGFFGLVGLLIYRPLPQDSTGVVFLLFGAIASGFTAILGYFFGSSKGSSEKTELLVRGGKEG